MNFKTASKSKINEIHEKIKNLKKERIFLIEDVKTLEIAIDYKLKPIALLLTENILKEHKELLNSSDIIEDKIFIVSEKIIKKLKQLKTNPGVIALFKKKKNSSLSQKNQVFVALDRVQDPGNVGTILRSAISFNVGKVLLSKGCASVFNPKVVRGSMGAAFIQNTEDNLDLKETLEKLKQSGYKLFFTSSNLGKRVNNVEISGPAVFVFGNESKGISNEVESLGGTWIKIPTKNRFDSLNVAVAASIIMYEIFKNKGS